MKRKTLLILSILAILLLVVGVSAVALATYDEALYSNSLAGGGAGGGAASSEHYRMSFSFGGTIQVAAEGASHQVCSGFICSLGEILHQLFLPLLGKASP